MKGTIHQEEISILNKYKPKTGIPIYIRKTSNGPNNTVRCQCSDDGRPEYPTVTNRLVIQTEDQQRNFRATPYIGPNRHGLYLQSISPKN
jgi:hypothetical protein